MNDDVSRLYDFAFRGQLAEQSLDAAGRRNRRLAEFEQEELAKALSLDMLDDQHVVNATAMATVYVAIAAFENSVRSLITNVLMEQEGADWWENCVSRAIRERAENKKKDEEKVRWHVQRGMDPINYTLMGDWVKIFQQNWPHFEPYIPRLDWAEQIFEIVERSRNVIMHSGMLARTDIDRIGLFIRDWIKQVGA